MAGVIRRANKIVMRWARCAAAVLLAYAVSGCSVPSTTHQIPTPTSTPAPAATTTGCIAKHLDSNDTTTALRYQSGSNGVTWWVNYAVLSNVCQMPITNIRLTDQSAPGSAVFVGQGRALPVTDEPPFGFLPANPPPGKSIDGGYAIAPGATVEIMASIRLTDVEHAIQQVPRLGLEYSLGPHVVRLSIGPRLRFTADDPPPTFPKS